MTTTTTRIAFTLSLASLVAACSGHDPMATSSIGAAGGSVTTSTGITLRVPAGALSSPTELRIVESTPRDGAMARVSLEPAGLALAAPATISFKVADGNVKVAEIEHGAEGEVRRELEKRRHDATGEVEVEVEHLAELEMEHGRTCQAACGDGFECDDGVCQAHVEDDPATHDAGDDAGVDDPATHDVGDDGGVDPAPAPGAPVDDGGNHGAGHP